MHMLLYAIFSRVSLPTHYAENYGHANTSLLLLPLFDDGYLILQNGCYTDGFLNTECYN